MADADPNSLAGAASLNVLIAQDGSQETMPLDGWLSWTNSAIARLADEITQTRGQLTARTDSLDLRLSDLDARLNEVLAVLDEFATSGRHSEADIDHYAFQRTFSTLANQEIGALVDLIVTHRPLSERDRAILTSRICWMLFGTAEPSKEALVKELELLRAADEGSSEILDQATQVFESAKALRDRMAGHSEQHWDFGFQIGSQVDRESQEEWSSEPVGGIVEFVVVPSYVIGGYSILSKQRVYAGGLL